MNDINNTRKGNNGRFIIPNDGKFFSLLDMLKEFKQRINISELERQCDIPTYTVTNCVTLNKCKSMYLYRDEIYQYFSELSKILLIK